MERWRSWWLPLALAACSSSPSAVVDGGGGADAGAPAIDAKPAPPADAAPPPPIDAGAPDSAPPVKLRVTAYDGFDTAVDDLEAGKLDLVNDVVPVARYADIAANPDLVLTDPEPGLTWEGLHISMHSPTWAAWGCPFDGGSSACGAEIRKGFAHLVDKHGLTVALAQFLGSSGGETDLPAASIAVPYQLPDGSTVQAWDALHPGGISAFNLAPDDSGFAATGSLDFCAAADHFIAAGVATGKDSSCVLTGVKPEVLANPVHFFTNQRPFRMATGDGLADAVDRLFGAPLLVANYDANIFDPDFTAGSDWDILEYGLVGVLTFSDISDLRTDNPFSSGGVSIAALDQAIDAAAGATSLPDFSAAVEQGFDIVGAQALEIPLYTRVGRSAYLRAAGGVVDAVGSGISTPRTLAALGPNPGYTPHDPSFAYGGGDPRLARWGVPTGGIFLHPFLVNAFDQLSALSPLYDTLLVVDPAHPEVLLPELATVDNVANDALGYLPPVGTVTSLRVHLRAGLEFHDGQPISARDVKFSLLALRDLAGGDNPIAVTAVDDLTADIHWSRASFLDAYQLALDWIFPRSVWELRGDTTYGDVGVLDPATLADGYDPLAAGALIGSGPFRCRDPQSGAVGTGCTSTGTGLLLPGDTMLLERVRP